MSWLTPLRNQARRKRLGITEFEFSPTPYFGDWPVLVWIEHQIAEASYGVPRLGK